MRVKELMSHPAVTCPETATLDQAARLMWEYDCGVVPVVNDDGKLAGVVTDRDICMAAYAQGKPLAAITVATAMAKQVVASHLDDDIESAEALMRDNQIRRVPVLDGEARVQGVVSMNDFARAAARAKRSAVDRELVRTIAAICQPHVRVQGDGAVKAPIQLESAEALTLIR
jgi:CBS domain-containing protein